MKARITKTAVGIGLLGLIVYFGRGYLHRLDVLGEVTPGMLALLGGLYLLMRGIQGEVFRLALKSLGLRIGRAESFLLTMLISLTNLVLPRAGMGAPAVYMKVRHSFRYPDFLSLLMPIFVLQLTCIGLVGLACQFWLWASGAAAWQGVLAAALAGILAVSLAVLACPVRPPRRRDNRLANFFRRFLASWETLRKDRRLLLLILGLQAAVLLTQGLRLWCCFLAIGVEVPFAAIILASLLGHLGTLAGCTPGGLGLREAAIAVAAKMMDVDTDVAVAAAVLDRVVMTAWTLLLGLPALGSLHRSRRASERIDYEDRIGVKQGPPTRHAPFNGMSGNSDT